MQKCQAGPYGHRSRYLFDANEACYHLHQGPNLLKIFQNRLIYEPSPWQISENLRKFQKHPKTRFPAHQEDIIAGKLVPDYYEHQISQHGSICTNRESKMETINTRVYKWSLRHSVTFSKNGQLLRKPWRSMVELERDPEELSLKRASFAVQAI